MATLGTSSKIHHPPFMVGAHVVRAEGTLVIVLAQLGHYSEKEATNNQVLLETVNI